MNKEQQKRIKQAKTIDEPMVANTLRFQGWEIWNATDEEDRKLHVDLWGKLNGKQFGIDVKRSNLYNRYKDTFTYTVISSGVNNNDKYNSNEVFAFIDDITKTVILVQKSKFYTDVIQQSELLPSKTGNGSFYIEFKKEDLRKIKRKEFKLVNYQY